VDLLVNFAVHRQRCLVQDIACKRGRKGWRVLMVVPIHDVRFLLMNVALESLMREPPVLQFPRRAGGGIVSFILIGGGAAASFVVLSSVLVALLPTVEAWIISAACYAAYIVPVYQLHRRFTFASDVDHRQALPRYATVQGMALLLATLFGYVFHGTMSLPSLPAAMLVIALTSGVNYLVLKGWAFAATRRFESVPA
jgi:putative flippase GtrA